VLPLVMNQNLNRTQKNNCLKKIKRTFLGRYKRGPSDGLSHEQKFKQDVKTRSTHSGEDAIYGMGGLIRK